MFSGTLNGLILYANILSVSGLLDHRNGSINPFLRAFISWINRNLGIEVCFYSGMDVYQKTWLQFVSLLHLVPGKGHHSCVPLFLHSLKPMGTRNNIEVLATLSYAKLSETIVTTLSLATIRVSSAQNVSDAERVRFYDAHL